MPAAVVEVEVAVQDPPSCSRYYTLFSKFLSCSTFYDGFFFFHHSLNCIGVILHPPTTLCDAYNVSYLEKGGFGRLATPNHEDCEVLANHPSLGNPITTPISDHVL